MTGALLTVVIIIGAPPATVADPAAPVTLAARPAIDTNTVDANIIDKHVFAKLRSRGIVPAAASSDTEFLRRLTQTTTGQLPTPDEVRQFVADERPDKRAIRIQELLCHDLHAALWATRYSEWTGNSTTSLSADEETVTQVSQQWHQWLRDQFSQNVPYDQVVRSIVVARSRGELPIGEWVDHEIARTNAIRGKQSDDNLKTPTLDLFWKRNDIQGDYPVRELAERVASTFLGVRINCARCHDHPFDEWSQADYQGFVRIFEQVRHDMSPELRREMSVRLTARRQRVAEGHPAGPPLPRLTEVYLVSLHDDNKAPTPKPLGGPDIDGELSDYRIPFADWMTSPQNRFFARNAVNRAWAFYFGRGLVEPLDGLTDDSDSIAYPKLLEELAQHFSASGYDIRELELLILNSRTWQLSSEQLPSEQLTTQTGDGADRHKGDNRYLSRADVRLPPAAVVVDMWHAATGIDHDFGDDRFRGRRAVEIGPDNLPNSRWDGFQNLFGRPKRSDTCDCSPKNRPSVRQALTLMSDPRLLADISRGKLARLLDSDISEDEKIDTLFLQTLSRWPTPEERAATRDSLAGTADGEAMKLAWENVLWSLLNTQEFITIH